MAVVVLNTVGSTGQYNAWITADVISQDTVANTSYVRVRSYVQRNDGYSASAYNLGSIYRYIRYDGANEVGSSSSVDTRGNVVVLLKDTYYTITHSADGTKTVNFSAYLANVSGSLPTYTINGNYSLPTIPRKSTSTFSNFTIGNDIAVNTNRASSSFTHTLKLYVNGTLITTKTSIGASTTITPTSGEITAMYGTIPNSTSTTAYIVTTTYNGGTSLGDTTSASHTVSINTNACKPTFTDFTPTDTNATTLALGNDYVKGYSNLKVTISSPAVANNGSSMVKYRIVVGSSSTEYAYTNPFDKTINAITGSVVTVTAVDSRNLETSVIKNLSFINYVNPLITLVETKRTDGIGTEVFLKLTGTIFDYTFDNGENIIKYFGYRTRATGGVYSAWYDKTSTFNSLMTNTNGNITLDYADELSLHANGSSGGFTLGQEYDIEFKISDGITAQTFNSAYLTTYVSDGKVLDGHYKDTSGEYHSGYNGMPTEEFNHTFYGNIGINEVDLSSGWIKRLDEWTYASANTINVPNGAAAIYGIGDKIKLTQTTVKYFSIVAVADTLLTVTGGSDYTVANAAISEICYSHQENPLGFPSYFHWTPVFYGSTGSAGAYNYANTISIFTIRGTICEIITQGTIINKGSWTGTLRGTLPVTPSTSGDGYLDGAGVCANGSVPYNGTRGKPCVSGKYICFLSAVDDNVLAVSAVTNGDGVFINGKYLI